ncbi:redoxin domain-containing protein [Acetobacterium malicum]|uniref:Redoxin domain-containing protein n=1 Tax=Acetobacterium malicum TaxID=52692 RepID=A0ABR6YU26_9FIRM|nr:TlpA disulfide reductase family protein [Acetobacterium malicum]MBC3898692.1 redoxin domain-containing protein [Acetobacterium malicum]
MNNKIKTIIAGLAFAAFLGIVYVGYTYLSSSYQLNLNTNSTAPKNLSQKSPLKAAPDFTVTDEAGNPVKLSDFRGKPIVLNFWASWCPPCKSEMPHFNKLYSEKKDDVVFLMVDYVDGERETTETGLQYVRDQGFDFPIYFDTEQEAAKAYEVTSIPATFFINTDGKIVTSFQGAIDETSLNEDIQLILN